MSGCVHVQMQMKKKTKKKTRQLRRTDVVVGTDYGATTLLATALPDIIHDDEVVVLIRHEPSSHDWDPASGLRFPKSQSLDQYLSGPGSRQGDGRSRIIAHS